MKQLLILPLLLLLTIAGVAKNIDTVKIKPGDLDMKAYTTIQPPPYNTKPITTNTPNTKHQHNTKHQQKNKNTQQTTTPTTNQYN